MRKNDSDLTVDQVLTWVMSVLIVGVFNWLWFVVVDDQFRALFWRLTESPIAPFGLR